IRKHPAITGISRIGRVREWLVEKNPNLMQVRRYGLIVAALIVITAVSAPLFQDINWGVEFRGGRVMEYEITGGQNLSVDEAREGPGTGGHRLGGRNHGISRSGGKAITGAVGGGTGGGEVGSDQFIGPSMGRALPNRALLGLGGAVILQMAFLAWRFRWSFG